ncbi:hypothetical protein M413DRAFT_444988 [Hebeloma cylindrosporum]|uniref:Uncharacterized protein n=1 Tax=Hebeloma cylindrosporum TaxID=76867 RepID=A0A0C3BYS8_HEBCY|nr:hypothetical protein M413DRAFT_444988 [Hebeloma cylindrosporum h7]
MTSVTYRLTGHLGWTDASEAQLAWIPVDSSLVSKDVREKVEGAGEWYHYNNHVERTATAKLYRVAQKAKTDNWIFVPVGLNEPGTAEIALFGTTLVDFYTKVDLTGFSSGWVKSEWSTKISFDSSKPGEPVVVTTEDLILPTVTTETSDALLHEGELAGVIAPAKDQLEQFHFGLQNLRQRLKLALEGDWPFFIPTEGGRLYVDKVFFSKSLDLVCELQQRQV